MKVAGRALWAWPETRSASPRGPSGGVGREPDGECHAGPPRAAFAVGSGRRGSLCVGSGAGPRAAAEAGGAGSGEAGVTGRTHGRLGWPAALWLYPSSVLAPRRGRTPECSFFRRFREPCRRRPPGVEGPLGAQTRGRVGLRLSALSPEWGRSGTRTSFSLPPSCSGKVSEASQPPSPVPLCPDTPKNASARARGEEGEMSGGVHWSR